MSDASMPDRAAKPEREVDASEQSQFHAPPNASGSSLLDANIAAGANTNPEGEAIDNPIATNFSSTTGTGDDKTADAATIAGSYSAREQSEKGSVNLHNNPDVPSSDMQGTLPNTDPIGLPIDTDVNHQE